MADKRDLDDYLPFAFMGACVVVLLTLFVLLHLEASEDARLDAVAPLTTTCIQHPATRSKVTAE